MIPCIAQVAIPSESDGDSVTEVPLNAPRRALGEESLFESSLSDNDGIDSSNDADMWAESSKDKVRHRNSKFKTFLKNSISTTPTL